MHKSDFSLEFYSYVFAQVFFVLSKSMNVLVSVDFANFRYVIQLWQHFLCVRPKKLATTDIQIYYSSALTHKKIHQFSISTNVIWIKFATVFQCSFRDMSYGCSVSIVLTFLMILFLLLSNTFFYVHLPHMCFKLSFMPFFFLILAVFLFFY